MSERERFEAWLFQFRELAPLHGPVLWEAWQAALAPAMPPGYVLVPVEPTPEMKLAGAFAPNHRTSEAVYRAMIAAAPSAKEPTT